MPLKQFICPDGGRITPQDCLAEGGCRMKNRCATRSYLHMASSDRPWTGTPSTTQLIAGTMQAYLKIKHDYAVSPDSRAFMINGTRAHANLETYDDDYSLLEEVFKGGDKTGIADVYEQENGKGILVDRKISGSYKVSKALGWKVIDEDTGEVFKTGTRKGQPKTRKVLVRDEGKRDIFDWEMQLNSYRMEFERRGFPVHELRIECIVRDGNTFIARSRGVVRALYYFNIPILPDMDVVAYFDKKRIALEKALEYGDISRIDICNAQENWDGIKCERYCEVAEFCPFGKYIHKEKESEEMAIKNISDVRRLPRLGKIRLGIKKVSKGGKEYPSEVDYFILDPETPVPEEREKLIAEFHRLYGDKPKQMKVMFVIPDKEQIFPQYYKRYGSGTLLQCKGDGETAVCSSAEFTKDLEVIGKDEFGLPKVKCAGRGDRNDEGACPYYASKACRMSAVLMVLLPDLPGMGVWQIHTTSVNSIFNMNSGMDFVGAAVGRFHMVPIMLERRQIETVKDGIKSKHYPLFINQNFRLSELQRLAQIDATKILLQLPEPVIDTVPEDVADDALAPPSALAAVAPEPDKATPPPEPSNENKVSKPDFSKMLFLKRSKDKSTPCAWCGQPIVKDMEFYLDKTDKREYHVDKDCNELPFQ